MYDLTKHIVEFFIRRFNHIVEIENVNAILRVLLFCFKNNVLKWYNELSLFVQIKINKSLTIWKNELFKKFRFNRFNSIRKVQQMFFHFDKNITFNQYFLRKINLLRDANIINETLLIHYFWKKIKRSINFRHINSKKL